MRSLAVLLFVIPMLSGCAAVQDAWDQANRPDIPVQRTDLREGDWNRESRFVVVVRQAEAVFVEITAQSVGGAQIREEGYSNFDNPVSIIIPDGIWTVTYWLDGHEWESFKDARIDTIPPTLVGLDQTGSATDGKYTIGQGAVIETGASVKVVLDGLVVATSLPAEITVSDGLTSVLVIVRDAAGNEQIVPVNIRQGNAEFLPDGKWDFGVVARYSNSARVWDLSDMTVYATPAQASAAVQGKWLGSGYGVTPNDQAVRDVVYDQITSDMTSMEIGWQLFSWLFENTEYDEARLDSTTLMLPRHVILDSEDPDGEVQGSQDGGDDGLADDGAGNGVRGGVCRDLAATYVSLLRAAGVPARLVSGYLAGDVNGFHAWVEFYAGDVEGNPGPWVPVDVSPMDGKWADADGQFQKGPLTAMTAFGISEPQYLTLRALEPEDEVSGWSTALSTRYTYPSGSPEPRLEFRKELPESSITRLEGKLCFNMDTRSRNLLSSGDCNGAYYPFVVFTERIIDYGIEVISASSGTEVTGAIAVPYKTSVAPDTVEYGVYGQGYTIQKGKAVSTFSAS